MEQGSTYDCSWAPDKLRRAWEEKYKPPADASEPDEPKADEVPSVERPAEDDWADPLAGAVARVQAEVEIEAAREAATEEMALDELDEHL